MKITEKDTKILCTLGPASMTQKILQQMHKVGMDAVRINTAHGDFDRYRKLIKNVRRVADIPIMVDIKGPELRIRSKKIITLKKGEKISLQSQGVHFNYNILPHLKKGDTILIADGKYTLKVTEVISFLLFLA
jgi:pyruvate kinase